MLSKIILMQKTTVFYLSKVRKKENAMRKTERCSSKWVLEIFAKFLGGMLKLLLSKWLILQTNKCFTNLK